MLKDTLVELGLIAQYLVLSTVAGLAGARYVIGACGVVSVPMMSYISFMGVFGALFVVGLVEAFIICSSIYYFDFRKRITT